MSIDVTERAELEQLLAATRASGLFTWSCELDGGDPSDAVVTFCGARQVLGYDVLPGQLGPALDLFVTVDDRARVLDELRRFLGGTGERYETEYRIRHADGSVHWTLARMVAARASDRAVRVTATCVDITPTRRSTERFEVATKLSGIVVWNYDLRGGDLAHARSLADSNVLDVLGYPRDTAPIEFAAGLRLAILPEDQERVFAAMQACVDGTTPMFEAEYRVRHKDGSVLWRLGRGVTIRDDQGRPLRYTGTSVDVTRLKETEAAARATQERLELGMKLTGYIVSETDLRGVAPEDAIIKASAGSELDHSGPIKVVDYLTRNLVAEDAAIGIERFHGAIRGERSEPWEYRVRNPSDGSLHWRLGEFHLVRDDLGAAVRLITASVDIQRVKAAEQAAQQAIDQLQLTTRLSGVNIWTYPLAGVPDPTRAKVATNENSVLVSLGYEENSPVTLAGRLLTVVHPEDQSRVSAALVDCVAGNTPMLDTECRFVAKDGSVQWKIVRGIVTRDSVGQPILVAGTVVDIQRLKIAEEQAHVALQELQDVKDRLELAVAGSKAATWDVSIPDGDLSKARAAYENLWELLGYSAPASTELATVLEQTMSPQEYAAVVAELRVFLASSSRDWEREVRAKHEDGTPRWHLTRGVAERDGDGRPTRFTGTTIDITDRKLTEERLQDSEERFRLIFENAAVGMITADVDGRILSYNARYAEFLGYDGDELIGRNFFDVMVPEEVAADRERYRAVADGEALTFTRDKRYVQKDGTIVWGNISVSVIRRHADGTPRHLMGILQDINERKQTEQALQDSEERFRHTFENAAVGMIISSTEGRILESNARWREFLGYAGDQVTGRSFFEFMVPDEVAADRDRLRSVLRGDVPSFTRDKRYVKKDGTIVWGNVTVSVVQRDAGGTPTRTMGILQDISERKVLEAEIERSKRRLELAMRGSDIAVYHGEFLDANPENAQWTYFNMWEPLGYDAASAPEEFAQRKGLAIHPDDEQAVVTEFAAAVQRQSRDLYTEHRVLHRDGSVRWRLSRGTLVYDQTGMLTSLVGTEVDITQLKKIEGELLRAREAAEAANRAKDEFLANVSHEIRTPMNAILGMTELAIDSAPTDHQRQLLSTVRSAATNLLTIINDLLDFSKIASGKLTLDRADFSLRAAVGDTLRALAVRAHRKGLELICRVRPDVPDALDGDAGRLRQVLMNLVGNAIKFTPRGEVEVDVAAEPSSGESVVLSFAVRDTGIGIARDKQAAIFHAFEQEDASTTRKYGGTGLGLTISAQLASLMDGDITVQSAPGCGSTFRFTARFARSSNPEAAVVTPERLGSLRVLVVDDNEANQRILVEWLTSWRMQPTSVGDAAAAIAALASARAAGAPFALVLLDARMPDTDGISLAREIRQRWGAAAPRLILLSSDDRADLSELAKDNGVLAYLLKPVQQSELLEAIWAAMNLDLAASGPERGQPERSRPLRVLVAEDNELNVMLLRELLGQRRHIAQFAGDGRAALELALQSEFDLMLLDLHMPELDGFEVVAAIREHERGTGQHLRIIALTARSSARDRERCLAAGMDEFLSKPIEAAALWATMDRLVAVWPLAAPRAIEPGLLDARAILRACGGKASILEKLRVVFRRTLPIQMSRVRSALDSDNLKELREAAHQLVATIGTFSTVAAGIASALEDAAVNEARESCAALVQRLDSLCDALLDASTTLSIESLSL